MSCLEVTNDSAVKKFNNNIDKGVWLVWFYAEWCGHCKHMAQPWNDFARVNRSGVNLAKVREEYVPKIKSNPNIQGWPTIMLYKNGQPVDIYQGERTSEGFNHYVNSNSNSQQMNTNTLANDVDRNDVGTNSNNVIKLNKPKRKKSDKKKKSRKRKRGANTNNANPPQPKKRKTKRRGSKKKSGNKN